MKTIEDIMRTPRLIIAQIGNDGGAAQAFLASSKKERPATVIFSWGGDWDHVSVSFPNRCPTWDEMCEVKKMFFYSEEIAWEYHPAESEYVNMHPYCLHIWRYQKPGMVQPPSWMVGLKDGQTYSDIRKEANEYFGVAKEAALPASDHSAKTQMVAKHGA